VDDFSFKILFMRKALLTASIISAFTVVSHAQVQQAWVRKFVGFGNDNAAGIAPDRLGNVYICGNNNWGSSTADMYTVRYNSAGTQTSGILYNSPYNNADVAKAIVTDASNNVYVAGTVSVNSSTSDIVIIKYNSSAVQQWATVFNTPQNYIDDVTAMAVDNAGNVYITGSVVKANPFEYDYLTAKFNSAGTLQWSATYNGTSNGVDIASSIAVDASGNVYITGLSAGQIVKRFVISTGYDYATIKYDANGNQSWVQRYNGYGYNDEAKSLALDGSGNVYVTGVSPSASTNQDCLTIKYANDGILQWASRYAGSAGHHDGGIVIKIDGSGNAYVAGYSYNSSGTADVLGIKYDPTGLMLWVSVYNVAGSGTHDVGKAMGLDVYGSMYIAAETSIPGVVNSDYLTLKYGSNGVLAWAARYNGPENGVDYPTAMTVVMPNAPPGAAVNALIYVTGSSNNDVVTIKYSQPTVICCAANLTPVAEEISSRDFKISNYPNPVRSYTNIEYELPADGKVTISVYDIHGRKVATVVNGFRKAGAHTARLSSANLAAGQYHYQCIVESVGKTYLQTKAITVVDY
jgi:hypothetical protein